MPGTPRKTHPHAHAARRRVLAAFQAASFGTKVKALAADAGCSCSHAWHVLQKAQIQCVFVTLEERVYLRRLRAEQRAAGAPLTAVPLAHSGRAA